MKNDYSSCHLPLFQTDMSFSNLLVSASLKYHFSISLFKIADLIQFIFDICHNYQSPSIPTALSNTENRQTQVSRYFLNFFTLLFDTKNIDNVKIQFDVSIVFPFLSLSKCTNQSLKKKFWNISGQALNKAPKQKCCRQQSFN